MGATGQPAGSSGRGKGPRPWWTYSRTAPAVFGAGAAICTTVMEVVDHSTQIVLLSVTVLLVLLGLAALVPVQTYVRLFRPVRKWAGGHRILVLAVVVGLVASTTGTALWLQSARSCQDPTELAVMVPEDGAAGFAAAAAAFEQDSITPFSCPLYHVTTFGAGWPALRSAFASGWPDGSGQDGVVSLDLGPRPDVWIAESAAQVDIVVTERAGESFTFSEPELVAGSPLVLAVPEPHAAALQATAVPGDTAGELIAAAGTASLDVVRANPDTSFASALHTVDLYAEPDSDAAGLELDLGRALEQAGLPVGTDSALLCRLDELSLAEVPRVAVLTTERAMVDGGAACPASAGRDGDVELVPFYPGSATGLDYTAVRLTWSGKEAERRAGAAAAFVGWLTTAEGQAALDHEAGVRPLDGSPPSGQDGPLPGLQDAPDIEPGSNAVPYARVLSAETGYREARRPARVLALVDSSASMSRPADGDRRRLDVAVRGVLGALGHLSGSDEVGVWTFSGTAGSSPRPVLELTASDAARGEAPELLEALEPDGHTPLYDAIAEGTSYLAGLDTGGAARRHLTALVVLTDGENLPGGGPGAEVSAADLVAAAGAEAAAGVRVYVVAVGEASCQVSDLQQIASAWDGECWDSSFGELENTLGSLFGQLGGR